MAVEVLRKCLIQKFIHRQHKASNSVLFQYTLTVVFINVTTAIEVRGKTQRFQYTQLRQRKPGSDPQQTANLLVPHCLKR